MLPVSVTMQYLTTARAGVELRKLRLHATQTALVICVPERRMMGGTLHQQLVLRLRFLVWLQVDGLQMCHCEILWTRNNLTPFRKYHHFQQERLQIPFAGNMALTRDHQCLHM